jgi:hypothetical protein
MYGHVEFHIERYPRQKTPNCAWKHSESTLILSIYLSVTTVRYISTGFEKERVSDYLNGYSVCRPGCPSNSMLIDTGKRAF